LPCPASAGAFIECKWLETTHSGQRDYLLNCHFLLCCLSFAAATVTVSAVLLHQVLAAIWHVLEQKLQPNNPVRHAIEDPFMF